MQRYKDAATSARIFFFPTSSSTSVSQKQRLLLCLSRRGRGLSEDFYNFFPFSRHSSDARVVSSQSLITFISHCSLCMTSHFH